MARKTSLPTLAHGKTKHITQRNKQILNSKQVMQTFAHEQFEPLVKLPNSATKNKESPAKTPPKANSQIIQIAKHFYYQQEQVD